MPVEKNWNTARRILCVRLDNMGDLLMTTPAFRAIKESRPDATLTLLTSVSGSSVASLIPEIDDTVVFDAAWVKSSPPRGDSRGEHAMTELLREFHFDGAVIFTVFSQNPLPAAMLCYLADIPLRLAFCHENPYQLLTHWLCDEEPDQGIRHEVRRQLALVRAIGCRTQNERLSIRIPSPVREKAARALSAAGINLSKPWVIIHPGASAPSRRYPAEYFASVAERLVRESKCQIVFTGSSAETALIDRIRALTAVPCVSLAGLTGVEDLAATISIGQLLISNNTGPVHIAAAAGTPVVDLYALTNPQHTPWNVAHRLLFHDVPCKYCYKSVCPEGHHDCLRRIPPEIVAESALELLFYRGRQRDSLETQRFEILA